MHITVDDGFYFGLGVFETVAVEQGRPLLLTRHLKRLEEGMAFLDLHRKVDGAEILSYLEQYPTSEEKRHGALKITVTEENVLFGLRASHYTGEQYRKGFVLQFSDIRRNETSPFTYHKTLNYGDCILEKRAAAAAGINEKIFINTKGQISEGTVCTVFFVRKNMIYTPQLSCGLLPGILREYIMERFQVTETIIYPDELMYYEECFVTNSLMGVMPVRQLGNICFPHRAKSDEVREVYEKEKMSL